MSDSERERAIYSDDHTADGGAEVPPSPPALIEETAGAFPPAIHEHATHNDDWSDSGPAGGMPPSRTWHQELPRWLASLNPGRTQREYEKAIGYFFETPGMPAALDMLTFDLLLAYRGALALRATAERDRGALRRTQQRANIPTPLPGTQTPALPSAPASQDAHEEGAANESSASRSTPQALTPLAPATVNIRLTALRQFLCYCALAGSLPQLTPDRIRAALRRLSIERRRPYQILAEPEWEQFLAAARAPLANPPDPWGTPRASRTPSHDAHSTSSETSPRLARSRAGLTGTRTARRDHALVALALATGLRAVELSGLDVGDLSREWHAGREEWWLVLPDAKTKGQRGGRTLPLAAALVETLHAYLRATGRSWERPADRQTPLFLSAGLRRGPATSSATIHEGGTDTDDSPGDPPRSHNEHRAYRRLTPNDIGRIVDRIEAQWLAMHGEGAGNEHGDDSRLRGDTRLISPHALRHSTAVALLEGNEATGRAPASVEHVRGWLGHFDIRTTQGYLAHLEARKHRRPFALSPLSEPPSAPADEDGKPPTDDTQNTQPPTVVES